MPQYVTTNPAMAAATAEVLMDVEIRRRAESLNERDHACVGGGALHSRLADQEPPDDPVHDAQHRCELLGMGGEQNP
jgi:hypothetical protein